MAKSKFSAIDLVVPVGVRRAIRSITKTKDVLKQTAVDMAGQLPGQAEPGTFEEGDIRNIADSKLRYQAMYEEHQWSPGAIKEQLKIVRRTKITAFLMAIFSVCGVIALTAVVGRWLSLFLIPIAGCTLILGFAQGFKYALYEAQLSLEDFISAREFVSRDDFLQRLIG